MGRKTLTVVCVYAQNRRSEYLVFLETPNGVLFACGSSWGLQSPVGGLYSTLWWWWRHLERGVLDAGPFGLNLNGGSLLDFCACHGLSITNTMLKHDAQKCPWYQSTFGQSLWLISLLYHQIWGCMSWTLGLRDGQVRQLITYSDRSGNLRTYLGNV